MKLYHIIGLIIIALLLAHCKKVEVPDPVEGDPVFTVDGLVAGDSLSLVAGDNAYYMFTSTGPDTNGVYEFVGHLRPEGCADCGPALKVRFRDIAMNNAQDVNVDAVLNVGDYAFYNAQVIVEERYLASFSAEHFSSNNAVPVSYLWDFGDGSDSQQTNPTHEYENGDDRVVSLRIVDDQNCVSFYEKIISFDSNQPGCGVDFSVEQVQGGQLLEMTAIPSGVGPYTYSWNTGETTAAITQPIQVDSFPFILNYCLTITDNIGCTSSRCRDIYLLNPVGNDIAYCSANFSADATIDSMDQFDPLQFSTVIVEYTDEAGTVYRSDAGEQTPGTHFFQALNVEDFMDNEDGLPTKKLGLLFSCRVFASNGSVLELTEVQAEFGVAYPE